MPKYIFTYEYNDEQDSLGFEPGDCISCPMAQLVDDRFGGWDYECPFGWQDDEEQCKAQVIED